MEKQVKDYRDPHLKTKLPSYLGVHPITDFYQGILYAIETITGTRDMAVQMKQHVSDLKG